MAMGNKRPGQPQSSSSISPSKAKKSSNNNTKPVSKKKSKKEENLRAKAVLHRQQLNHDGPDDHRPILRPKVYITDISNFMALVQELTGNGAPAAAIVAAADPIAPQATTRPHEEMGLLLMNVYDQSDSDSVETGTKVDSSGTPSFTHEEMNSFQDYGYYDQKSDGMLACQADLEAWLQDMDKEQFPLVFETNYSMESHQQYHRHQEADLSIYDYDFSGIVC